MLKAIFTGMILMAFAVELTIWSELGAWTAIMFGCSFLGLCVWVIHRSLTVPPQYMVVHQIFHGNPYEIDPEHQIFHSAEPDSLSDLHPGDQSDRYKFIKETDQLLNMWENSPDELPEDKDN